MGKTLTSRDDFKYELGLVHVLSKVTIVRVVRDQKIGGLTSFELLRAASHVTLKFLGFTELCMG